MRRRRKPFRQPGDDNLRQRTRRPTSAALAAASAAATADTAADAVQIGADDRSAG